MSTTLTGHIVGHHELRPGQITLDSEGLIAHIDYLDHPPQGELPLITPGFVDLHNHGGAGGAFPTGDTEQCRAAATFHRTHGTLALLASLVSQTEAEITRQLDALAPLFTEGLIAGVHLEGPFLNVSRKGAQSPDRIQSGDPEMLQRIIDHSAGAVRQLTLAPETDNARELIDICARNNIIVSFGHTDADFATAAELTTYAAGTGATVTATHLFNAMPPLHHRAPGAAAAFLEAAGRGQMYVELIGDGVHLDDGTVDMVTTLAPSRAFAVTDAIEAAGLDDGDYILGPLEVVVAQGTARLRTSDGSPGAIAGGTSTMAEQFLRFGRRHGFVAAAKFTSTNAAEVLGETTLSQGIRPGVPANLVVLNRRGEVLEVYRHGRRWQQT